MIGINWNWKFILLITSASQDYLCFGAKLERKQDFFDTDNFDSKREYGLNEIGKRGFTSTLGYDYSTSTEYGIGGSSVVSPDYSGVRSGGSGGTLSPARDLVPPPVPGVYSSSTSPPTTRSDYNKFDEISSSSSSASTKDFYSPFRSQLSRRSPTYYPQVNSLQTTSNYFDDIASAAATHRGGSLNSGSYGLVADGEGKLIGYRGSVIPGYSESSQSVLSSSSRGSPEQANFIGGYYPGSSPLSEYPKPKLSAASSANSGIYTSTPVYYPGREEDHTYRMRDTTSQGYGEDDDPSSEDNDFRIGGNAYQASPVSQPSHYHGRENDGPLSHLEKDQYVPYRREHSSSGFSYGHAPVDHRRTYDYRKRSYNAPNSPTYYSLHGVNSLERPVTESYASLGFNDYGSP